ncbi:flagellar biosynthesis protein [Clostridium aestuarii]|uniref:Flagellar biosynthesis protein n=1 Tax=Clostridium aestuarii TaxID=338193 RepID=A0ABT4CXV3_9CLOT|nr:TIGR02530 family flagellar biosynthesis protein [Clostridium aestuarii]MCY6483687.1 flagellar biosynthesis protein [Clostridium aestuarii]
MGYRVVNGKLYPVGDFPQAYDSQKKANKITKENSFDEILKGKLNKDESFTISKHAAQRLKERNIRFNEVDMKSINEGINKAKEKGAKEALILYKNAALVTSIKNRTVITAVDSEESKGNVFTNIDSVVLL